MGVGFSRKIKAERVHYESKINETRIENDIVAINPLNTTNKPTASKSMRSVLDPIIIGIFLNLVSSLTHKPSYSS